MSIQNHQVVAMKYILRDPETKEIIDQSPEGQPLFFITGLGQIIPGLEAEIMKMNKGDKGTVLVKARDAYGEVNPDAFQEIDRAQLEHIDGLKEGMVLYGQDVDGNQIPVVISKVSDEKVTVDLNHPLAGKDLLFEVEIEDVRDATPEELEHGHVHGPGGHHH